MPQSSWFVFCLPSFACLLVLSGCGGGPDVPETAYVEGVVLLDGAPLPGVVVSFQPQGPDGGRASIGKTDEQGVFVLKYNTDIDGAIVGPHKVSVSTPSEAPDPSGVEKDPIPAKYNVKTELTADVVAGKNDIPITLSGS